MSTVRFTGNALAVAQVTSYVFAGTWEATDVVKFTINGKVVSVVAGSTSIATILATLTAAWNDLDSTIYPEFAEITASDNGSSTFTLTGDTAGKPFTCTISTTETGGGAADAQTIDGTTSSVGVDDTACSGPNWWSVAANWSGGAVPVDTDDVYIEATDIDILYGLTQTSINLTSLNIAANYTGKIGLPDWTGSYVEYRTKTLAFAEVTTLRVGYGEGPGSQFIRLNTGTAGACACSVLRTASPLVDGGKALMIVGNHSGNSYELLRGSVGLCMVPGDTGQGTVRIGYIDNAASDVDAYFGSGFTFGSAPKMSGGRVETNSNLGTLTMTGGELTISAGTATLLLYEGIVHYNSTGQLAAATIGAKGVLDFARDMSAKTLGATLTLSAGATVRDPFGVLGSSPAFLLNECRVEDVRIDVGYDKTLTVT